MEWILLFVLVGMLYGIYFYWDEIKYEYSDMGFWGKCFSWLIVLSLIGHIFG